MKKIKFTLLTFLTVGTALISAQERGNSFSPNYKGYYYLRTAFTGDELSLEANNASSKTMNGAAFMSSQKGASGTMWQLVPDEGQRGWYRLKTQFTGGNKCLEANGKDSPVHGGASFMDDCKNVSGQLWVLELVSSANGDHIYRLRVMGGDKKVSLEGNKPGGDKGGNAFMNDTQNVSGQMWRLIPTQSGGAPENKASASVKELVYQKGWSHSSPNRRFTITFQDDGNLVLYKDSENPIWASNTSGRNADRLVFQNDGNLVIYDTNNRPLWNSNTANRGAKTWEVQDDGNVVLYTANRQAVWATNTAGR